MDTVRIAHHFHKSTIVGYLITSMFLLGYVFGPIVWGPGMLSRSIVRTRENLTICCSVRTAWATSSHLCGILHISAHVHRPSVGSQYGDTPHNALLRRGLRFCPRGDGWWHSRRYVGCFRSDHSFRDFLDLCSHWPMSRDDSWWTVSSRNQIKGSHSPQRI